MGVQNNEAVLSTCYGSTTGLINKWISELPQHEQELFAFVPGCNGMTTVLLSPSGSKKGWGPDLAAKDLRDRFIELIKTMDMVRWVEVGYGEFGQAVLRGNNRNEFNDLAYAF